MVMAIRRILSVVVLIGALALVATRATATTSGPPSAGPCTASALTSNLINVASVQKFGCESTWAYLWATVGVSGNEIGVTELMAYANGAWQPVSRATYCHPGSLPEAVYRGACFSN